MPTSSPRTCPAFMPLALMVLALLAPALRAQPAAADDPASRELLRQQERERLLRRQFEATPEVHIPRPPAEATDAGYPGTESPCFRIERIVLEGEHAQRFAWAIPAADRRPDGTEDPVAGRCLGAAGIGVAMRRIQNAVIARGFVTTRVLAPAQDLTRGELKLTVIAGRVGVVRPAAGSDPRATLRNAVPAATGDLLNLRAIEQGLENLRRVPTADADIVIEPAAEPGESDLVVAWRQGVPMRLALSVDDAGTRATGRYQGAATLSVDHVLALNDLFYLTLLHDLGGGDTGERGTRGHVLHYSLPLGWWLASATSSRNRYHQAVAGASQTYIYSGDSENGDLRLSRVVWRDAVRRTTLSLRGWWRVSRNFIDDTEVEVQRRRTAGWELGAGHRQHLGLSTLDLALAWRRGTGARGALPAPEDAFGEGASRPRITTAEASHTAPLAFGAQRLRLYTAWRAQWGRTPLVPQDRFAIGGRYTVRGFDGERVLSAQRGWLLRNDLAWILGASGQELFLGLDHGEVGGAGSQQLAGTRLTGAVLGLRGAFGPVTYEVFAGGPLREPSGFHSPGSVAGFSLAASF